MIEGNTKQGEFPTKQRSEEKFFGKMMDPSYTPNLSPYQNHSKIFKKFLKRDTESTKYKKESLIN